MKTYDFAVIGTGPSGLATLIELLPSQKSILVVDRGAENIENNVEIEKVYEAFLSNKSGLKPDSDRFDIYEKNQIDHLVVYSSKAVGGFSKVWGRSFDEFTSDYLKMFGDQTNSLLLKMEEYKSKAGPLSTAEQPILNIDKKDRELFYRMAAKQNSKNVVQSSQILLNENVHVDLENCRTCGHCIMKCPRDYLFSTNSLLRKTLVENKNIDFVDSTSVTNLNEKSEFVEIVGQSEGQVKTFAAQKVFLAAGPLETAKLLSRDTRLPVKMLDNAYYMFPFLDLKSLFDSSPNVYSHSLTLFKLILKKVMGFNDSAVVQIYHPRRLFEKLLSKKIPKVFKKTMICQKLVNWTASKFYIAQVFLGSSDSPSINMTFENAIVLKGEVATQFPKGFFFKILALKLRVFWRLLLSGCVSIPFLWIKKPIGTSFHTGGYLHPNQTDRLSPELQKKIGQIYHGSNIVVVDSSVLPELPAGSPTLTIMANAARIASYYANLP